MQFSEEHRSHLEQILRWRRDVRHFRSDPIPEETLTRLEASVDLAPSVGNSQPWRIVRVRRPESRQAVLDSFHRSQRLASEGYDESSRRAYRSLKLSGLAEAPTHLAFFTDLNPQAGRGLGRQSMPETPTFSTVMAIHTLWLTARSLNIGVGWVSILEPDEIRRALDVPEAWALTGYLCLGFPRRAEDRPELEVAGWEPRKPSVWIDR